MKANASVKFEEKKLKENLKEKIIKQKVYINTVLQQSMP